MQCNVTEVCTYLSLGDCQHLSKVTMKEAIQNRQPSVGKRSCNNLCFMESQNEGEVLVS